MILSARPTWQPAEPLSDGSLEGTTPFEKIRFAVVFFLSRDEYDARQEHSTQTPINVHIPTIHAAHRR
jgi:hypothetical protein